MSTAKSTAKLNQVDTAAGSYWGERLYANTPPRYRWWDDETTRYHINRTVCGAELDGLHAGFHKRLGELAGAPIPRAISVGCGVGTKEFGLLQSNIVEHFDLYEISEANVELGLKVAKEWGVAERINFRLADVFSSGIPHGIYDLVYWNNALHHMPDVFSATEWSYNVLKPGGIFAMDDFIGPSRFQWTDENLRWANRVRQMLTERLIQNPWTPGFPAPREVRREPPKAIIKVDPSEAADSGRIVEAILRHFPDAEILPTGGALYHLALNDILSNFVTEDDMVLLNHILAMDQILAENGTTHYGVAFARKAAAQPVSWWQRLGWRA